MEGVRALAVLLVVQLAIGVGFVALAMTGNLPWFGDDDERAHALIVDGRRPRRPGPGLPWA